MKILNNLSISFIFGILIIIFIIWNRLLRVRLPKELVAVEDINWKIYIILSLAILFGIFAIYYILLFKYLPRENSRFLKSIDKILKYFSKYNWFNKLYKIITEDIPNGPLAVYDVFYQYVYIKPYVEYLGSKLHNILFEKEFRITFIYIILFVAPRVVVVCTFIIEIIFFKQISYFYTLLFLLIIPIISKLLLYIIKHHSMHRIDYFKKFFEFHLEDTTLEITFKTLQEQDFEGLKHQKALSRDLAVLTAWWEFYQYLYNITYQLLEFKLNTYKHLLNSIYYSLFFIGFLFYFLILINVY